MDFNFNPRKYEEQLSPFGRNVLKTLMRQWREREYRNTQRQVPTQRQNKKILTFKGNNEHLHYENKHERFLNSNTTLQNHLPEVPKSIELVKSIGVNEETEYLDLPRDSIILSAPDYIQNAGNIVFDLYNNSAQEEDQNSLEVDDRATNKNNDVAWNDMFDTELIQDINDPNKDIQFGDDNLEENHFDLNFSNEFRNGVNETKELSPCTQEIKKKRKAQTKITDTVTKKVKTAANDEVKAKNPYRKQKYTKTVKNWLDDVDPNNSVEEEILENKNENEIKKPIKTIEKVLVKAKKKVIQAQLANKDGIMKFRKPKNVEDRKKKTDLKENESKENQETDKDKEKKAKPKFVAPIKSQIPVRDITYTVHTLDNSNAEEVENKLNNIQNHEVILVIHYNNGFSQLNSHYTDDSCTPEGIFIGIEDSFYYLKTADGNNAGMVEKLIRDNKIICYDGKNVLIYLRSQFRIEINGINIIDAKIGGSLLNPDNPPENFTELQKLVSFTPQYTIATECVLQKTGWYMTMLRECVVTLQGMLMESLLSIVFVDIEMRLLPIIADMEMRGVSVDLEKLKSMEDVLLTKMKAVEQECYKAAGKVFQINSAVQVRAILYDELQLDTKCNIKIRETITKGAKSTSETMLRSLMSKHPLPKLILEYRHLHKAHATFLTGIAQHIKNGVVKPTWVQTAAATGRIASNNPNLQAIPKAPFSLVMFPENGENGDDMAVLSFRSVYISRAGWSLVAADFKHVECRVFAHAAADTGLLDALKTGHDLFRVLAAKWLNKPVSAVSRLDRERTKRIVYASLYGAGARKLMDILDLDYDHALSIGASFNSSAADLCKMAMILTDKALRESSPPIAGYLVLQIHDELVWEVCDEHLERAVVLIKQVMENCGHQCGMAMTLPVSISKGKNWGSMTEVNLI